MHTHTKKLSTIRIILYSTFHTICKLATVYELTSSGMLRILVDMLHNRSPERLVARYKHVPVMAEDIFSTNKTHTDTM